MNPTHIDQEKIESYLEAGHWCRETMVGCYAAYARDFPNKVACRDAEIELTWRQFDEITTRIAANLIGLGLQRDARVLVQIPSSSRDMVLRAAFKKAGILGCFAPMQWRRREMTYTCEQIDPSAIIVQPELMDDAQHVWLDESYANRAGLELLISVTVAPSEDWLAWSNLVDFHPNESTVKQIVDRQFRFDEVSLITASSGTSSLSKLNEWPEGAQLCIARGIVERLGVNEDDNIGMFAPMSGAAGVLVWVMSAAIPCAYTFPRSFSAPDLWQLVEDFKITVATTVPVILARLAQESLESFDLSSLRAIRVGTGAASIEAARYIEQQSACRIVVASGAMECPGFGHAHFDEPAALRLSGSTGLPLPGCSLRIDDDDGNSLPHGELGHVKVSAPFASSGYWNDPEATATVWSDGWYTTGDIGVLSKDGRLTLLGRAKEVINRSGHKILPMEVELEIAKHPDVFQCAVVAAPDAEYGEVPWAFIQIREGRSLYLDSLSEALLSEGLATYKIPTRYIELSEFPRVGGNKIDKKLLLNMAPADEQYS
tara:strand:+ start:1208 stop:2836 length:1629 start_codon:yes stop_codon:yes gene_type:complete